MVAIPQLTNLRCLGRSHRDMDSPNRSNTLLVHLFLKMLFSFCHYFSPFFSSFMLGFALKIYIFKVDGWQMIQILCYQNRPRMYQIDLFFMENDIAGSVFFFSSSSNFNNRIN